MVAVLLFAACKEPSVETVVGPDARVTVVLTNPTVCSYCDPFLAVDTLRVDALANGELVASESFAYPAETPVLPYLDGLGVVRIEIVGLSAGRVESGGRTEEISLESGQALTVPMLFLPVNTALPLPVDMVSRRSRAFTVSTRTGGVVMIGGVDAAGTTSLATVEAYDPDAYGFVASAATAPAAAADIRGVETQDGRLLFAGGFSVSGGVSTAVASSGLYDPALDTMTALPDMALARNGHCMTLYDANHAVVFGGSSSTNIGEIAAFDAASRTWSWSVFPLTSFDATTLTGCVALEDGTVFVQGTSAANTGVWNYPGDLSDPGVWFAPPTDTTVARYVDDPVLYPNRDGSVWIAGGSDVSSGAVTADGRSYSPTTGVFSTVVGLQEPRFDASWDDWIEDGWLVVGCGWQDGNRVLGEPTMELVSPSTGESGPRIPLDRERDGCAVRALGDGVVLVTGGFSGGEEAAAAVVVPWLDES